MNSLTFKKLRLITVNLIAGCAIAWLGIDYPRRFELPPSVSLLIFFITSFLISAFCLGNAYRFSQKYEEIKTSQKKALVWFFSIWLFIFLILSISLIKIGK